MTATCKLCLRNRALRQSHIIPEFCYKPIYDGKHRVLVVQHDRVEADIYVQKGFRDRLLCDDCEQHFNRWEKEFKALWYDRAAVPPDVRHNTRVSIGGFNYTSFKLFHLSILWRAGVAKIPGASAVQLGPYEEKLRIRLLESDPGMPDQYPIYAIILAEKDGGIMNRIVSLPERHSISGTSVYLSCYAGVDWYIVLTETPSALVRKIAELFPQPDGTMSFFCRDWRITQSVRPFFETAKWSEK